MSSLYIGVSGLNVSQNALNTTAHNLANVQTNGYVRQQVLVKDEKYNNIGMNHISTNQVGLGASINVVKQVRDMFLDKSYREALSRAGFYDSQNKAVEEVEGLFGEMNGVAFQDSIEDFWESIQELVKEPDDIVKRGLLVNTAVSFVERAQNIQTQLDKYQVSLNEEIQNKVDQINSIGQQIYELNSQIRFIESAGVEQANDYRDTRNLLLDELSNLGKITYKEAADGTVSVNFENTQFVTAASVNKMATEPVKEGSGMLKPTWPFLGEDVFKSTDLKNLDGDGDMGALKGLIVARGSETANYTDIPIEPDRADYNDVKQYNEAMAKYEKDVEDYNNTINASVVMSVQAQFDQLIHGIVTAVNDILCPNETAERTVTDVNGNTYTGIFLDKEKAAIGRGDGNEVAGTELFSRMTTERYTEIEVAVVDEDGNAIVDEEGNPVTETMYLYNEENPEDMSSLYTLSQLTINQAVRENVSLLPLSNNNGDGEYNKEVLEQLSKVWNEEFTTLDPNSYNKPSFKEYYTEMIGGIANRGSNFNAIASNQSDVVEALDGQRLQVAGVSSDEELTKLIQYQHSYNAAARYVNVVSEMLEHLVTSLF